MRIDIKNQEQKRKYLSVIRQEIETEPLHAVKYLDFGVKIIRVLCHTPDVLLFLNQQTSFVLRDNSDHFDETIAVGKIKNIHSIIHKTDDKLNPKINLRLRVVALLTGEKYFDAEFFDDSFSKTLPLIKCDISSGVVEAYDTENHSCYYAVTDFQPEEFIKLGHVFVQQLNILLKTDTVNLTHGAVFGYSGKGVLLCARGQRGKSTLTVHSLLNGCEYVSDDYQLLEKKPNGLYAYPIYSVITLSPKMYCQMYDDFNGKFCSNNGRKDKYVFNISSYHDRFKTRYPVKACLFPEIVDDKFPSIVCCSVADKGRAIVQLIHSTVLQMRDLHNHDTIRKLFYMVKDLPFYKFNLCPDIAKNTEYSRKFLTGRLPPVSGQKNLGRMLLDITFNLANILDTQTFTFYWMNKFTTNIYEMLLAGISSDIVAKELDKFTSVNPNIMEEFKEFETILNKQNFLQVSVSKDAIRKDLNIETARTCNYVLSLLEYASDGTIQLIRKKGE